MRSLTGMSATLMLALLAGCASTSTTPHEPLSAAFDCLRENRAGVISAHRAGAGPGVPENALAGIARSTDAGVGVLEVDVTLSADGVAVLMHDRTLDRTTTGRGPVGGLRLAELQTLRLRDPSGALTADAIPTLIQALEAASGRAVLMLDIKTGVSDEDPAWADRYRAVVQAAARAVSQTGQRQQVAFIAYTPQESAMIHAIAPWALQSVSTGRSQPVSAYAASGLRPGAMLAFTGTRAPDTGLFAELAGQSVEVIFGTLGRPGTRLDDTYAADGDLREYAALVTSGVQVIATDAPLAAQAALSPAQRSAAATCLAASGIVLSPTSGR
jgi:glycerophosphoryl diester phosphodiesterase